MPRIPSRPLTRPVHAEDARCVTDYYSRARALVDDLPDPRTLSTSDLIAQAQAVATLAQAEAEAMHAAASVLSRISIALEQDGGARP